MTEENEPLELDLSRRAPKLAEEPLPQVPSVLAPETPAWDVEKDDDRTERKLQAFGLPVALLIAVLFRAIGLGGLQRIFFGMWLHELGHATVAWLGGLIAFPGPWLTPMSHERSWFFALLLAAGLGFGVWRAPKRWMKAVCGSVLAAQLLFTVVLKLATLKMWVIFGGDAGALIFGTLAMATLFSPPGSKLHNGWLRWGFLVIGSAAFVDVFSVWWKARTDPDAIPFGANEGVGASDPSRLVDDYDWSVRQLVSRYVALGVVCLIALSLLQLRALIRLRRG